MKDTDNEFNFLKGCQALYLVGHFAQHNFKAVTEALDSLKTRSSSGEQLITWPVDGEPEQLKNNRVIREMRPLTQLSDKSWVLGEWEKDKEGDSLTDIEGRVYHINKDFYSLYIGYMHDGKREGFGIELPLKNKEYRTMAPYHGLWHENKMVFTGRENCLADKYRTEYLTAVKTHLNAAAKKIIVSHDAHLDTKIGQWLSTDLKAKKGSTKKT